MATYLETKQKEAIDRLTKEKTNLNGIITNLSTQVKSGRSTISTLKNDKRRLESNISQLEVAVAELSEEDASPSIEDSNRESYIVGMFVKWIEETIVNRGYTVMLVGARRWLVFKDGIEVALLVIEHDALDYKLRQRSTAIKKLSLTNKSKFALLVRGDETATISNINKFFDVVDMGS